PHRERGALTEVDFRVVADAALRRAEYARVLDPVTGEDAPCAVVELDRDADDKRPLRIAQPLCHRVAASRVRERLLELRDRLAVERCLPLQVPVIGRNVLHFGHRKESRCGQDALRRTDFGAETNCACETLTRWTRTLAAAAAFSTAAAAAPPAWAHARLV